MVNHIGSPNAGRPDSEIVKLFVQNSEACAGKTDEAVKEEIMAIVIHPFPQGTGDYSWTLLFRATPIPYKDEHIIPILTPLLLSD